MRTCGGVGGLPATPARRAARHDGEFVQAGIRATATGDERDVQLVVEILPAENCRRGGDRPCGKGAVHELTAGHGAGEWGIGGFRHGLWADHRDVTNREPMRAVLLSAGWLNRSFRALCDKEKKRARISPGIYLKNNFCEGGGKSSKLLGNQGLEVYQGH
jgi:hypothetical protein